MPEPQGIGNAGAGNAGAGNPVAGGEPTGGEPTMQPTSNEPTPQPTNSEPTPQPTPPEFTIPEAYRNEKWVEGIKSEQDLWDQFANAQKLIGKKSVLQAPESPDAYEFKNIEPLQDMERDPEIDAKFKQLLHKHNIPKEIGEQLAQDYEMLVYELQEPLRQQMAEQEARFAELTKEVFGDNVVEAQEQFKRVFKESLGDKADLASILDTMPSEAVTALMAFSKKIHDTYVGENKIKSDGANLTDHKQDIRTQFQTLSQEKIKVKMDNTLNELVKNQKLQELNRKMMEIGRVAAEKGIDLFS